MAHIQAQIPQQLCLTPSSSDGPSDAELRLTWDYWYSNWMFSEASNVHVASDMRWFHNYVPFRTTGRGCSGQARYFAGVGEITLLLEQPDPHMTGLGMHTTLILHDVLYSPDSHCNIFSPSAFSKQYEGAGYYIKCIGQGGELRNQHGHPFGILDSVGERSSYKLRLLNQPANLSSMFPSELIGIQINWPSSERHRFLAFLNDPDSVSSMTDEKDKGVACELESENIPCGPLV